MPANRYFLPREFQENIPVFLEDVEFHHLTHVMRNRVGDEVELVNGKGQLAAAKIIKIDKKNATLEITNLLEASVLEQPLILAQAIPRLTKLEMILEKGTELGMTQIWLFPTQHSDKGHFSPNQLQRFNTIMISAMKQCGRLFLPEILLMPALKQWQKFPLPAFFGDTRPSAPLFAESWAKSTPRSGCIFCVGPESGFSSDEITALEGLGANGVKIHHNILRTETAAITALSLISHFILDRPLLSQ